MKPIHLTLQPIPAHRHSIEEFNTPTMNAASHNSQKLFERTPEIEGCTAWKSISTHYDAFNQS